MLNRRKKKVAIRVENCCCLFVHAVDICPIHEYIPHQRQNAKALLVLVWAFVFDLLAVVMLPTYALLSTPVTLCACLHMLRGFILVTRRDTSSKHRDSSSRDQHNPVFKGSRRTACSNR